MDRLAEVRALALSLMEAHLGLEEGWGFGWLEDHPGACAHARRGARRDLRGERGRLLGACLPGERAILLSRRHALCSPREDVLNTILHEIAHALTPGCRDHGPEWREAAAALGVRLDGFRA